MIVIEFIFILAIRGRYFNFHDTTDSFRENKVFRFRGKYDQFIFNNDT